MFGRPDECERRPWPVASSYAAAEHARGGAANAASVLQISFQLALLVKHCLFCEGFVVALHFIFIYDLFHILFSFIMSFGGSTHYKRVHEGWRHSHEGNASPLQAVSPTTYARLTKEEMSLLLGQFTQLDPDQFEELSAKQMRETLRREVALDVRARAFPEASPPPRSTRSAKRKANATGSSAKRDKGDALEEDQRRSSDDDSSEQPGPASRVTAVPNAPPGSSDDTPPDSDEESGEVPAQEVAAGRAGGKRRRGKRGKRAAKGSAKQGIDARLGKLEAQLAMLVEASGKAFSQPGGRAAAAAASSPHHTGMSSLGREMGERPGRSLSTISTCSASDDDDEVSLMPRPAMPAPSTGGLGRLVRMLHEMVNDRLSDKAITRGTPEKHVKDWLADKPEAWAGMVSKLTVFLNKDERLGRERWYSQVQAEKAGARLSVEVQGLVARGDVKATMARVRRAVRQGVALSLKPKSPGYVALVCACLGDDRRRRRGYRIAPAQLDELERSRFDPVLLVTADGFSQGRIEQLCVDALGILGSIEALGAEDLLRQACAIVLTYAVVVRSGNCFIGEASDLSMELCLRRVFFDHRLEVVRRSEEGLLIQMSDKTQDYWAWRKSHGNPTAREGQHKWQYRPSEQPAKAGERHVSAAVGSKTAVTAE